MIDMSLLMVELSKRFPLFHSEDDFKFHLAWLTKEIHPQVNVNLERKLQLGTSDRTDLVISTSKNIIPIELKYKTIKTDVNVNGERFLLKNQGAIDLARYDFLRDIVRIESLVSNISNITEGYSIIITMDESITKVAQNNTLSALFPIHNGNVVHGEYSLNDKSKEKYVTRAVPLNVKGHYPMLWRKYSSVVTLDHVFSLHYLIVKVLKNDLES